MVNRNRWNFSSVRVNTIQCLKEIFVVNINLCKRLLPVDVGNSILNVVTICGFVDIVAFPSLLVRRIKRGGYHLSSKPEPEPPLNRSG